MMLHVYLRAGTVYIPTVAKREGGAYTEIEPVAVVTVTHTEELRRSLLDATAKRNIVVPVPTGTWPPPVVLKYAGVKSWSAFARNASTWSIKEEGGVRQIVGYRKHSKGYWEQDPNQKTQFPTGATIDDVIDRMIAILQEAARR
jgi:hypothetical protein